MPDKDQLFNLLSGYGVQERYLSDLCDEIEEYYFLELEKARQYDKIENALKELKRGVDCVADALSKEAR